MNTLLLLFALSTHAIAQEPPAGPAPIETLVGIETVEPEYDRPADADVEVLSLAIGRQLRCPVCQGLSVADSQAETAVSMFARIKELVRLGYSEDQIQDYFVKRYGDWVLLAPPANGVGFLLWAIPGILIVGMVPFMLILTRKRPSHAAPDSGSDPDDAAGDPYLKRVLADLENQ